MVDRVSSDLVRYREGSSKSVPHLALARAQVSKHLSRRLPYYLTPEEAHQLIDAPRNDRDRLFLRLLWETGVRVSEAVKIRLVDVGRDGIRVVGKGAVERVVFVQNMLVASILFYAQETQLNRMTTCLSRGKVVISPSSGPIRSSRRPPDGLVSSATNSGGRLDALQEQLGHRDINTTKIYLRLSDEDLKREAAKLQL